ncbi:MAG TPA: D-Ala-D-Ala carboxypeptidase family metallohydrolase [Gemmatimonadaceae bacterium]
MIRPNGRTIGTTLAVGIAAVIAALPIAHPSKPAVTEPFSALASDHIDAGATLDAFGASREVRLRFALPGNDVEFPLEVSGDPSKLSYVWVDSHDSTTESSERPMIGSSFVAPAAPGFYHLAILRGTEREIISEPTLAVMVPFSEKVGATLNGYHIGTYLAERLTRHTDHPAGFLQVREADLNLKVSTHLRLADFVTHDSQGAVWPKYVALNPRLLDKLELVLATIGSHAQLSRPDEAAPDVAFDVHSGFRTPAHNRGVWRAAGDSRHQYGDAADVAIDADGDGRVTLKDEILVARAVDQVESEHPDLVGGLGLYTSRHYRTPYVHIDARGKRSRWTG